MDITTTQDLLSNNQTETFVEWFNLVILPWLIDHGIKILVIIIIAFFLRHIAGFVIERTVRKAVRSSSYKTKLAEEKRENTLIELCSGAFAVIVWIVAAMMVLAEIGLSIGPLLAGAGIIGVALGFGAQYLVRDIINGLFIILENQFRVGDVVCFDATCGTVEHVTLRMTMLRDLDGVVHYVPNGEVKRVSNMSRDFSRVNMNIGISYDSDIDTVVAIINAVGKELAEDPAWKNKITKAPEFLRVESFGDSSVNLKVLGDVVPLSQWEVAGELRRRIKMAFDKHGIEIPFPQRVMHYVPEKSASSNHE